MQRSMARFWRFMDFDLIVRREFGQGTLRVIEGNAGDTIGSENSLHLVYVLEGDPQANDLKANDSVYVGRADFLALSHADEAGCL